MRILLTLLVVFIFKQIQSAATHLNVVEIDDRIVEYSKQGKWLIMFYAPWCGHCKKLEPVYDEVGKKFINTNINVVKVDATKYTRSANNFDVKGYPTIKFVSSTVAFTFNGDRKVNDIMEFVEKADGPRVRTISSKNDYLEANSKQKMFFLLITQSDNDTTALIENFKAIAERRFLDSYFFQCSRPEILSDIVDVHDYPVILAVKEESSYRFSHQNDDYGPLEEFIKKEQFLSFTPVSITNFNNLIESRKILLILLTTETNSSFNRKLKEQFKSYSELHRDLHKEFQFGYTDTNDLLNNIAIWSLQAPLLFVLNTTNYKYSLIDIDKVKIPDQQDIDNIIENIRDFKLEFFGGDGWFRHFRRPLWELYRGIIEMFIEAPVISMLIFGIPFGVISIVCYFLCCFEPSDQQELDELSDADSDLENEMIEQQQIGDDEEGQEGELEEEEETKKTI